VISPRWHEKRKAHWARLEELVQLFTSKGARALSHRQLQEISLLYRQTASDLSAVREDPASKRLAAYLNQLLGRAHNLIYVGRRGSPLRIFEFFARTYPQVFRQTLPYTTLAFALFLGGAVVGALVVLADPAFPRYVLGGHMMDTIERRRMWTHSILAMKPLASSQIMTNNLGVGFAAFATGILAGIGPVYMMILNGLLLGIISTACWQAGMADQLFSFVAPHGVLELPAIFIAGGAGLLLARGLLFPGLLPRRASIEQAGGQAVRLVLGTIPMLFVAGIIEAFLSPTSLPMPMKFLFAAALFALFVIYLFQGGREAGEQAPLVEAGGPHSRLRSLMSR